MIDRFGDLDVVEVYTDDISVHAETQEQHDIRLRALLERCQQINVKLNKEKSKICKDEVNLLVVDHYSKWYRVKPIKSAIMSRGDNPV